jgi:NAD(P)-dependent dehydrogenase (short-subunit alcohol dehydrogenase family)
VLVNNAGIFAPAREITPEGLEKTFVTNYLSHFLLTNLLLDRLRASTPARIVNVASKTGGAKLDFEDLQSTKGKYSVLTAVPRTKLAQLMFTRELARRLEGSGVTVNAVATISSLALSRIGPRSGRAGAWERSRTTPEKGGGDEIPRSLQGALGVVRPDDEGDARAAEGGHGRLEGLGGQGLEVDRRHGRPSRESHEGDAGWCHGDPKRSGRLLHHAG